ncbi:MAG: hypothetical protein WBJ18_00810, partial [Coprothermobacter proteolyticus]
SKRYTEPIEPVLELTPEQKEILYNYSVKSAEKLVRLIQDSERAEERGGINVEYIGSTFNNGITESFRRICNC